MNIIRICLVGHSRTGKTSVFKRLRFTSLVHGVKLGECAQIFFQDRLPEVWNEDSPLIRQDSILRVQLGLEKAIIRTAELYDNDKDFPLIILSDRGCFDTRVYLPDQAERLLEAVGSPPPIDFAVILLPQDVSSTDNGPTVRIDVSPEEDKRLREAVVQVWSDKKAARNYVIIPPTDTIMEKAANVVEAINDYLGITAFEVEGCIR